MEGPYCIGVIIIISMNGQAANSTTETKYISEQKWNGKISKIKLGIIKRNMSAI